MRKNAEPCSQQRNQDPHSLPVPFRHAELRGFQKIQARHWRVARARVRREAGNRRLLFDRPRRVRTIGEFERVAGKPQRYKRTTRPGPQPPATRITVTVRIAPAPPARQPIQITAAAMQRGQEPSVITREASGRQAQPTLPKRPLRLTCPPAGSPHSARIRSKCTTAHTNNARYSDSVIAVDCR